MVLVKWTENNGEEHSGKYLKDITNHDGVTVFELFEEFKNKEYYLYNPENKTIISVNNFKKQMDDILAQAGNNGMSFAILPDGYVS